MLKDFSPSELEGIVCGQSAIDINILKQHTVYEGYNSKDQQIVWLWEILESLDQVSIV